MNPKDVPIDTISTTFGTVRLDASIPGSPEAAMHIRNELMNMARQGDKPTVTFADKIYILREPLMMKGGGLVTTSPDIRWVGVEGGATVQTKIYPEGHPKAGQRIPDSEQGLFTASSVLERFSGSSAFGLEKIGAQTLDDKMKIIADTAEKAKAEGYTRLSNKLSNLIQENEKLKLSDNQGDIENLPLK